MLLAVMYQRNRVLFIHLLVLNKIELNNIIMKNNLMTFFKSYLEWRGWCFLSTVRKLGYGKVFSDQPEPVKRDLRSYIEDWGKLSTRKNDKRTCNRFLAKYEGPSLYAIGFGNGYSIDDEDIHFLNGGGYALIDNPDHPDGTRTDHEYFCKPSFSSINDNSTDSRSKMRSRSEMFPPRHQLQMKQQKKSIIIPRSRLTISS